MILRIITPDQTAFQGEIDSVSVPTAMGELTILPHHIPLVTTLASGTMVVRHGKTEELFAVSHGVLEVDGSTVRVLTDIADRAESLQEEAIQKAHEAAQKLVTERRGEEEGFAEAVAILDRELARLKSVRRHRSRRSLPPGV